METIKGAYTSAQIFTTNNKENAIDQYAITRSCKIKYYVLVKKV